MFGTIGAKIGSEVVMPDILDERGNPIRMRGGSRDTASSLEAPLTIGFRLSGLLRNPDDIVRQRGLQVYDDMMNDDPQAKSGIRIKQHAIIAPGVDIVPFDDSQSAKEHADFIDYNFTHMKPNLNRVLIHILDGLIFGFSVSEKIFARIQSGRWSSGVRIARVSDKPPKTFSFDVDRNGQLKRDGLVQYQGYGSMERRLDPSKFLLWSYQKRGANYYGRSDLTAAFPFSFAKKVLTSSWAVALEKYADPIALANVRAGTTSEQRTALLDAMDAMQQKTAIVLPDYAEDLRYLEMFPGSGTFNAYERAILWYDRQTAKSLLIPELLSEEGRRGGSRALGETHIQTFIWILEALGIDIIEVINEDFIKPLILMNFKNVPGYPEARFNRFNRALKNILATLLNDFITNQVISPDEEWIRDWFGIPPRTTQRKDASDAASPATSASPTEDVDAEEN